MAFRGIKSVSGVELFLFFIFLVILVLFFVKAFPFINIDYFEALNLKYLTFPFGIILFSLWGTAVIPEVKEMFAVSAGSQDENKARLNLRRVIIWGGILSAAIYLFFILLKISFLKS